MTLYRKKYGWWLFLWSMCLMLFACGGGGGSGSDTGNIDEPNTEDVFLKNITSFSLPSQNGPVNGVINDKTISVTMPYGTDLTSLIATFTTNGKSVNIGNVTQISGTTPNNFTKPLVYTVTAADGSKANYTVTVKVAASGDNSITYYKLAGTKGVITGNNINVQVPYGTDVTSLLATFTTDGESVSINGITQVSEQTKNNFTNPLVYTVTAANGSTQSYTVTVTIAANSANSIDTYSLDGRDGVIYGDKIAVELPYGTDLKGLVATFTTSGKSVSINGKNQVSGQTPNNFESPLVYTVTAANGSTQDYTVTVTIAKSNANSITSYSLAGTPSVISPGNNIDVELPYGTDLTSLVATFTTSGKNVSVIELTH